MGPDDAHGMDRWRTSTESSRVLWNLFILRNHLHHFQGHGCLVQSIRWEQRNLVYAADPSVRIAISGL